MNLAEITRNVDGIDISYSFTTMRVLSFNLSGENRKHFSKDNLNYDLTINHNLKDFETFFIKLEFVIKSKDEDYHFGSFAAEFKFSLKNLDLWEQQNPNVIPPIPSIILTSILDLAISTSRGLINSTFSNTYLRNITVPALDAEKINQQLIDSSIENQ